eukprot:Hpha_TRINITY_DN27390_c0_g1::TRINITY_DN27390_c0_g1_i1::g.681::m.681
MPATVEPHLGAVERRLELVLQRTIPEPKHDVAQQLPPAPPNTPRFGQQGLTSAAPEPPAPPSKRLCTPPSGPSPKRRCASASSSTSFSPEAICFGSPAVSSRGSGGEEEEEEDFPLREDLCMCPAGPYIIVDRCGKGQFGSVWKVEDRSGRVRAAKVMPLMSDPRNSAAREVFFLSRNRHQHLLELTDFIPANQLRGYEKIQNELVDCVEMRVGESVLVEEPGGGRVEGRIRKIAGDDAYVEVGDSVSQFWRGDIYRAEVAYGLIAAITPYYEAGNAENISFVPSDLVRLTAQVTRAISYLHKHGIAHGDLKPENVLACARLDEGHDFVVADFGLSAPADGFDYEARDVDAWNVACLSLHALGMRCSRKDLHLPGRIAFPSEWMYPSVETQSRAAEWLTRAFIGEPKADQRVVADTSQWLMNLVNDRHENGTHSFGSHPSIKLSPVLRRLATATQSRLASALQLALRKRPSTGHNLIDITRWTEVSHYAASPRDVARALKDVKGYVVKGELVLAEGAS